MTRTVRERESIGDIQIYIYTENDETVLQCYTQEEAKKKTRTINQTNNGSVDCKATKSNIQRTNGTKPGN